MSFLDVYIQMSKNEKGYDWETKSYFLSLALSCFQRDSPMRGSTI